MTLATGSGRYNDWAVQLMRSVHPHFVYARGAARPHMHWKARRRMEGPASRPSSLSASPN